MNQKKTRMKVLDMLIKATEAHRIGHPSNIEECNRIEIPKDCCYIRFCKGKPVRLIGNLRAITNEVEIKSSADIGYTVRGEQMIADYDKEDNIIGIELLSSKLAEKPCMSSPSGIRSTVKTLKGGVRKTMIANKRTRR